MHPMLDALKVSAPPAAVLRQDYREPDWLVPEIALEFDLAADRTVVRATLSVERNGQHDAPLRLDGEDLALVGVRVDGRPVEHRYADGVLTISLSGDKATVETDRKSTRLNSSH